MRILGWTWWGAMSLATMTGTFLAVAAAPAGVWIGAAVLGGGLGGLVAGGLSDAATRRAPTRAALLSAAAAVALSGLLAFLPVLAGLYLAALAASALLLGARTWGRRPWVSSARGGVLGERPGVQVQDALRLVLREWSDDQLCRAWRVTYAQTRAADARTRLEAAVRRDLLLTELERRHPTGLAAWFADGPRAQDDPRPYLRSHA